MHFFSLINRSASIHLLVLALIVTLLSCTHSNTDNENATDREELILISYNIKNDYDKVGANNWTERKEAMGSVLNELSPTFLGVQEALHNQVRYLDERLLKHAVIGVGRDDGKLAGEFCAIYYDSTQYRVLTTKTIWLSPTPNEISTGWDAALPRIATFGLFEHSKTKDTLLVCNTHFDHIGEQARVESAKVIINELQQWPANKQVLLGDFNASLDQQPIQLLNSVMLNTELASPNTNKGPKGTFNGFNANYSDRIIDFIFLKGFPTEAVLDYQHLDRRLSNGNFLSDHFAVYAVIENR